MDEQALQGMLIGLLPTPAYIFGAIVFGIIGFVAYRFGKKTARSKIKWLGVVLMLYPYVTGSDTRLLYLVGLVLCVALYYYRNE
ncbi:hypothetical protein H8K32_10480 [Undibacterium jejuense]|uniref:Uncharacterized protein n=1 Tax=Undibacterium jejuense TaxID=1344949 RepID=A0A923KQ69_9BURK|nr:hypothetical protein [Undibacterium jejuense]MBC3862526.1 hypothetical protein [Undibacterium jejuense]